MGVLNQLWGRNKLQSLFERLHRFSLKGMNYGRASDHSHNGESYAMREIKSMISSPKAVLFDVGANKGEFTLQLLEAWGGMTYELYVLEPSKTTFGLLKTAVPARPYIHFENIGLGERQENVQLYFDRDGSGLASVYKRDLAHRKIEFSSQETIELTTLDIFCQQHKIDSIDFLKMDVEGHELAVLRGGKKMFEERRVRIVQFEFGGCNIDSRTYFRDFYDFFKNEFTLYRILSDSLKPVTAYSEALEIFSSANYLAVRK